MVYDLTLLTQAGFMFKFGLALDEAQLPYLNCLSSALCLHLEVPLPPGISATLRVSPVHYSASLTEAMPKL